MAGNEDISDLDTSESWYVLTGEDNEEFNDGLWEEESVGENN